MNPLLTHNALFTHNASLTLSMYAHGHRQLPAFDFLAHLLLIPIGFRQSCEGIKLSCNTKISWLAKAINEPKWSELPVDIIMHLVMIFSEYVSETFTHSLPLDTFNGDMYLSLSFVIYAELLPMILKVTFSIFSTFFLSLLGVKSSVTAIMLL